MSKKNNHSTQADLILSNLSKQLKEDPTSGASMFVDLLSMERLKSRAIIENALKYSLIFNVVLIGFIIFLAQPRTDVVVAQQRLDGTLAEVATTDKPYYKLQDIKDFAQKRAIALHNWTYLSYIQHFEDERQYWDAKPLEKYIDTLISRGVFNSAEQYRRRYDAVVISPINITQQVKYDGEYRLYRVTLLLQDESVDLEGVDQKVWSMTFDIRETVPEEGWAGLKVTRFDEVIKL